VRVRRTRRPRRRACNDGRRCNRKEIIMKLHTEPLAAALLAVGIAAAPAYVQANTGLPPEQIASGIVYRTGGIGVDEAAAFKKIEHNYPLVLEFIGKNSEYLADVKVTVAKVQGGQKMLETTAAGPFLMAKLSPGKYRVTAEYMGKREHRMIDVHAKGTAYALFQWKAA
jgi:hypothetical protein